MAIMARSVVIKTILRTPLHFNYSFDNPEEIRLRREWNPG